MWLKNNIRNLVNFHASSRKSENLHFDQILLSKAYKDLDEKTQKSYVSWQWRVMQSLKRNWRLVRQITWGILWIFTQPLKSPKISLRWAIFVQSTLYGVWAEKIQMQKQNLNKPSPSGFKNGIINWVNFP